VGWSVKPKKKLLQHLAREVFCRLGVSPTHGVGVFAVRTIPKGIDPLKSPIPKKEISFKPEELKHLPKGVRKQIKMFCYYDDKEVLIPAIGLNTMDFAIFLNHSKTPNIRLKKAGHFETLSKIKAGEELVMDYDKSFGEEHFFE
jgi:SET domain-containing protein